MRKLLITHRGRPKITIKGHNKIEIKQRIKKHLIHVKTFN